MKISIRKAIAYYGAIQNMKEAGVSAKGIKMIDLAMNKATLEPMVVEFERLKQSSLEIVAGYNREISTALQKDAGAINEKYKKELDDFEKANKDLNATMDAEREIELITVKKFDLTIKEDNGGAAEVLFGLLPCLVD